MKDLLHQLRRAPAGSRFRVAHDAARRWSLLRRLATVAVGLVVMAAGVVMLVAPGPGLVAIAAGLGMLGLVARPLAGSLDRAELALRRRYARLGRRARRALGAALLACASAAAVATMLLARQLV